MVTVIGSLLVIALLLPCVAYIHDIHILQKYSGILYTSNGRTVLITRDIMNNKSKRLIFRLDVKLLAHRGYPYSSIREL